MFNESRYQHAVRHAQTMLENVLHHIDVPGVVSLVFLLGSYFGSVWIHKFGYKIKRSSKEYRDLKPSQLRDQLVSYLSASGFEVKNECQGFELIDTYIRHENARVVQYYNGCFDVFLGSSGVMAGLVLSLNFFDDSTSGTDTSTTVDYNPQDHRELFCVAFTMLTATLALSAYGKIQISKTRVDWWNWRDRLNVMAWAVAVWNIIGLFLLAMGLEYKMDHHGFATLPLMVTGVSLTLYHCWFADESFADESGPNGHLATIYLREEMGRREWSKRGELVA